MLNHAICLKIDISSFLTIWAVLSILFDTQDSNLKYVILLQEEYNRCYDRKTREYMEKLEMKSIEIQDRMYDAVDHNFDRVSDNRDNGTTPLQGQQDEQPEADNAVSEATDYDQNDILTEYLPLSTETHDKYDSDEDIYDRNRKDIENQIAKDTLVKTEENKPHVDIIDDYNRYTAHISQSLSDRLGLFS